MDSLTAHYVARELRERWQDRLLAACTLDRRERAVIVVVRDAGAVRVDLAAPDPVVRTEAAPSGTGHLEGWTVVDVCAPVDDRRLVFHFERAGKFRGSPTRRAILEVSLVPAARAAVLRSADEHRLASLGGTLPPVSEPRPVLGADEIQRAARTGDMEALLRGRWMSPPLARWLIQRPHESPTLYAEVCALPPARPARCGARLLPFAWCDHPEPASSLLEGPRSVPQAAAERGSARDERARRRMRAELERAAAAPLLRRAADALMAMGAGGTPPERVELEDGTQVPIDVRAGDTPVTAAERLYRRVRSMERALEALPGRLLALDASPPSSEPAARPADSSPAGKAEASGQATALPYRTYRSTGGLEIWVGRGARANDRLTFREAAPDDVWLHARDAAGAHVVLRWSRDEPPPARDLEEAAILAAWHSKARSSTVAPVDWTRRKHVRKPRGASPGVVLVQHARTIFVRPDPGLEKELRGVYGRAKRTHQ